MKPNSTLTESAFNENHPYYDPKSSRDNPKWEVVRVKFVRKFSEIIPLSELRSFARQGGALERMQMLKQSRLSVSPVKPKEWHFINSLAQAGDSDESAGEGREVKGQVISVSEKVVQTLADPSEGAEQANGVHVNGEGVSSKLTTASSTGKDDLEEVP